MTLRIVAGVIACGLIALAVSATAQAQAPEKHLVVFHRPGKAWKPRGSFAEQPGIDRHVAHYAILLKERRLAMGGPFLDNSGGMMIAAAGVSKEELARYAADDPAVKSGVLKFEIREWLVAMRANATPK